MAKTDAILIADCITSAGTLPLKRTSGAWTSSAPAARRPSCCRRAWPSCRVSPKAWANIDKINAPALYLNLKAYRKSLADSDVPYTPAVTLIRGMKVALDMIHAIGIEKVWSRTAVLAKAMPRGRPRPWA